MRRREVLVGAAGVASVLGAQSLLGCATTRAGRGAVPGIGYFDAFGVNERLIRDALAAALSSGADRADLFFQHRVSNRLRLEDGEVNQGYADVELGVGIRAVSGEKTGYAFTQDLSRESVIRAAQTAAAIAEGPARAFPTRFHIPGTLPQRYPLRVSWDEVALGDKRGVLERCNASMLGLDPRVRSARLDMSDEVGAILLASSDGRLVEDLQPMTTLRLTCVAEKDGRREESFASVAARAGFDHYTPELLDGLTREAVARTVLLFDAISPEPGEMPVVLEAGSSGILLHEAIGHGMEADFNRKGMSIFSDRIGKPVAKPFVSIVDDGTGPGDRGALNVDDEGEIAGRTHLVEGGILATYLHDGISARHYGVAPTGNGRRESFRHPPLPRMRSTYMLPGPHRREELIASVKRGVYCQLLSNGQVQIGPGDFSFYVKSGYLIEDGKLTRPIKDVNLIGNGPKVLQDIDLVADDLVVDRASYNCGKGGQTVPVSVGMPTVRVASMTVGGRGGRS